MHILEWKLNKIKYSMYSSIQLAIFIIVILQPPSPFAIILEAVLYRSKTGTKCKHAKPPLLQVFLWIPLGRAGRELESACLYSSDWCLCHSQELNSKWTVGINVMLWAHRDTQETLEWEHIYPEGKMIELTIGEQEPALYLRWLCIKLSGHKCHGHLWLSSICTRQCKSAEQMNYVALTAIKMKRLTIGFLY